MASSLLSSCFETTSRYTLDECDSLEQITEPLLLKHTASIDSLLIYYSMTIFAYPFPLTGPVAFHDIFKCKTAESKAMLERSAEARERAGKMLAAARNSTSGMSFEPLIAAISAYLPHLFSIASVVEGAAETRIFRSLVFRWRASLGGIPTLLGGSDADMDSSNHHFEIRFILLSLGYAYSNEAGSLMQRASVDGGDLDGPSKVASQHLRTAAGIFDYLADIEARQWTTLPEERAPELVPAVPAALCSISMAQAQELAVRIAVAKGTSSSLVAKLIMAVYNHYVTAQQLLTQRLSREDYSNLIGSFREYVRVKSVITKSVVYKLMGSDAKAKQEHGKAVAYLQAAVELSSTIRMSADGGLSDMKAMLDAEHADNVSLLNAYSSENSRIYYEPVPPASELILPEPKQILDIVPFVKPEPLYRHIN
eukprot:GILK01006449.1.p1 GENE.GILK01006449.1~~GILK01006449.1.p1  ORF type:complete len:424 (-),score=82.10 GILK01006449.1:162-1433(-)